MTVPGRNNRPRIQLEIDNEFLRQSLRSNDWAIGLALLATVDLIEEPHALDLICEVVELRAGGAPEAVLKTWGARARTYLLTLIGDPAAPELRVVN